MGEMQDADIIVTERDVTLDTASAAYLASPQAERSEIKNVEILRSYVQRPLEGKLKRLILRFLVSPVEVMGTERVEGLKIVHNEAYQDDKGEIRARATDQTEVLPVALSSAQWLSWRSAARSALERQHARPQGRRAG
ncbi:MAG: hypothetical protein HC794_04435, partial [Nitrospiraceae bacterium]|nr:hypothetical protein [Nitrospiraceae bacterium]